MYNKEEIASKNLLINGDSLKILMELPDNIYGGVITDPPYSSGGAWNKIAAPTKTKYTNSKSNSPFPDFSGDQKDARSYRNWMYEIFSVCRQKSINGAVICTFCDWRQLPNVMDALQWADWTIRGIMAWDKQVNSSRPQRGRFRQQCEFIIWGSKGGLAVDRNAPCLPGAYSYPNVKSNRRHLTEKPLQLMRDIVKIVEPGLPVLDPFMGSGTTIEAAALEEHPATGIEVSGYYYETAKERLG